MKLFTITLTLLFLASCNFVSKNLFGIKYQHEFSSIKYQKFLAEIDTFKVIYNSYIADTSQLNLFLKKFESRKIKKNLYQPVQILYFKDKSLVSFHANCFAQKGLKLDWNMSNRFDKFIPQTSISLDSMKIDLEQIINSYHIKLVNNDKKIIVFIFWSLMMEKASRSAIYTVIKNLKEFKQESSTEINLVNLDKIYISYDK